MLGRRVDPCGCGPGLRDGLAWRYVTYDKAGEFAAAEADAREHRRGLWAPR
jgi:endonuclease YncB( thermonuclease family)